MIFLHNDHEDNEFFNRKKQQGLLIHLDNGTTLTLLQQNKCVRTIHIHGKVRMANFDKHKNIFNP